MKNRFKLVQTLMVAGVVVAFANVIPGAQAALTTAQIYALNGPGASGGKQIKGKGNSGIVGLPSTIQNLLNAAQGEAKTTLAKDIALWLGQNAPRMVLDQMQLAIKQLCVLVPAAAPQIAVSAAQGIIGNGSSDNVKQNGIKAICIGAAQGAPGQAVTIRDTLISVVSGVLSSAQVIAALQTGVSNSAEAPANVVTINNSLDNSVSQ